MFCDQKRRKARNQIVENLIIGHLDGDETRSNRSDFKCY